MNKQKVYREAFRIDDELFDGDAHSFMESLAEGSPSNKYEIMWDITRMEYVVVERCYEN